MFCESGTDSTSGCSLEINDTNSEQDPLKISIRILELPVIILLGCLSFSIYNSILVKIGKRISQIFWDFFTVSIEVSGGVVKQAGEDVVYHGLVSWLSKTYPDFSSRTATYARRSRNDFDDYEYDRPRQVSFLSSLAFGTYYIQYKDQWVRVERYREPLVLSNMNTCETIVLTAWAGQQDLLDDILEEATNTDLIGEEDKTYIYRNYGGEWIRTGRGRMRRPKESVILEAGILERIIKDVHDFLEQKEWYLHRDIPHRRGYLLYGPPGCGKTTLVKAMAGELGYDICVLSLSSPGLSDDDLVTIMEYAPQNAIILMEDIDAAFKSREENKIVSSARKPRNLAYLGRPNAPNTITFRGLLNALDGVDSSEDGRIICMTTNYVEKLDPALIRCGRVDLKIFIDYPSDKQLRRLFQRFYETASEDLTLQFIKCIRELKQKASIALIQGLFLIYKESAEDAVKYAKEYFEEEFLIGEMKPVSDQLEPEPATASMPDNNGEDIPLSDEFYSSILNVLSARSSASDRSE